MAVFSSTASSVWSAPGADADADGPAAMSEDERSAWVRAATTAGWLLLLAYLSVLAVNIQRARTVSRPQFSDGVWGQRIEILSFTTIPQQSVILAVATAAAVGASVLATSERDIWVDRLLRSVAGAGVATAVLAVLGIAWAAVRGSEAVGDFGFLISRLGGLAIAVAVVRVCLVAERVAQTPRSPSR